MAINKVKNKNTRVAVPKCSTRLTKCKTGTQQGMKIKNQKTLIITQEIKFARLLANNNKKVRNRIIKNLIKWLTVRSKSSFKFTETDFMNLWKGLFYCMWLCDKMLIQEELAETLSKIVHCFKSKDTVVLYTTCALKTLAIEWFGIDHYRLDKFAMLVRKILRETFIVCKNALWNINWITNILQVFEKLFLHPKAQLGFKMHLTEIYLEELAKIGHGTLPKDVVQEFIRPFIVYLITTKDEREIKHIMHHVFRSLIVQSDVGLDYAEKFNAWRKAGFPCTRLDEMEKVVISDSDSEDDSENEQFCNIEKPLDPRAGKIDVELSQIFFDPEKIVQLLSEYTHNPLLTSQSRRQLLSLINDFNDLSHGHMPFGIKRIRKSNARNADKPRTAAIRLLKFQKDLLSDNVNKKYKKKRNRQLITTDLTNKSADISMSRIDVQNKEIDTVPFKKRKIADLTFDKPDNEIIKDKKKREKDLNLTCEKSDNEIINDKKKLDSKPLKKDCKTKNIQMLKYSNNTCVTNKNVKCEIKKTGLNKWQVSDKSKKKSQSTCSPISQNNSLINKNDNKSVNKQISKSNMCNKKMKLAENKLPTQKTADLHNPIIPKKRVKIVLQRNTAHHTSEYIQKVRKSPAIPFDANKKPLISVLKANPIPSPVNPFYKKNLCN